MTNNFFYKFDFIFFNRPHENQFTKLKLEKYKLRAWLIFFLCFFFKYNSSKSLVIFTNSLIKTPKILGMRKNRKRRICESFGFTIFPK